ncbi:MAG: STAS domain-containing protein [Candidatus Acidiferrales bacterium]
MNAPRLTLTRGDASSAGPEVLTLIGPLVMATTATFQEWLRSETAGSVILDFNEVPFIDSAGLGAMISIFLHYKRNSRKLALVGVNEKCHALFRMTNVESLFPNFATVDDARKSFA